jgi:hypothetical protein
MALHRNDIAELKDTAMSAIRDLNAAMGRPPKQHEYKRHANANNLPTLSQVLYQFDGSWTTAIEAAGLTPNQNKPPRTNDLTDADLIAEFIDVANRLGKIPTKMEFGSNAKYSVRPYSRWGKWTQVKAHFARQYRDQFSFTPLVRCQPGRETAKRKQLRLTPSCVLNRETRWRRLSYSR